MSRHNRRRTRGGSNLHKQPSNTLYIYPISSTIPNIYTNISTLPHPPGLPLPLYISSPISSFSPSFPISNSRTGISARHWHNRYMAWQAREKRQREESARLEAEKKRIFGWEGDVEDEELCEKMLEYFGGLDFIEW